MTRVRFGIAAMVASAMLWSLALAGQQRDATTQTAAITGTGEISGRVVSADANPQPMRRALVTLTGPTTRSELTDDTGAFAFTALPAGTFTVTARKAAYLAAPYGARRPGRPGTSIALAAGQRVTIAISMFRGAAISGTLRDAAGAPVAGVDVRAMDARALAAGLDPSASRDFTTSDDRGVFRMYGLLPGEYILAALPGMPGREIGAPSTSELDAILGSLSTRSGSSPGAIGATAPVSSATPSRAVSFAPVFYPGATDLAGATGVRVAAGEEASGIDFVITSVPVGAIEGVVSGPVANLAAVEVTMFPSGPRIVNSFNSASLSGRPVDAQGRFRYGNLSPGRYRVVARARQGDTNAAAPGTPAVVSAAGGGGRGGTTPTLPAGEYLYAFADVELTGDVTATVNLTLQSGGTLSGRIVFAGTAGTPKPDDLTKIRPSLSLDGGGWSVMGDGLRMGPSLVGQSTAVVKPDGTFEIRGIGPGRFTLNCTLPTDVSRAWSLRSATVNNRDLLDDLIDVAAGGDLRNVTIAFSDTPTVLTGSLQLPSGQTTTDYHIVVLPADRALWRPKSRRIVSVRPSTDGQFSFTGLPAGEYLLAAMTDVDPIDLADPEFLAQLVPAAVKVTVVEGEARTQPLRIR
jgi:uncharacterized protein (DUF2141 family)